MNFSLKQLNAEFFRRKKNDIIFISIGIVLLIIMIWVFVSSIDFLLVSVNTAIDDQTNSETETKFNMSSLEKLGIMESVPTSPATTSTTTPR